MRRRTFAPGASLYPQVTSPPVIGPGGTFGDASPASPAEAKAPTTRPRRRGRGWVGALPRPVRGFIARWQQAAAARREAARRSAALYRTQSVDS